MRINCYLPRANGTNSSIDCSHNAGLGTATFCQLSLMLVLPDDWVEGSQCSPPVSNDDTAQFAPRICVVCIGGFVELEHSIHVGFHATGLTNKLQMESPLLTAPVFGIQHRGCEGHAVGYCDALRQNKRSG